MKKIEAIIRSQNFPQVKSRIAELGSYIMAKHSVSSDEVHERQRGSKLGSTGIRGIPLVKIELVVPDKDAKNVIGVISELSGIRPSDGGKIFVSEMTEIVDMATLEGQKDTEAEHHGKRSRLVPLQKYTLFKVEEFYERNRDALQANYKIKSFSDFVNFCVLQYLAVLERPGARSVY